jgi:hypothetical protein
MAFVYPKNFWNKNRIDAALACSLNRRMRIFFALLMCLVFSTAQCFAIKGGPPYPGGTINLTGTYAGVLQPSFDPTDPFSANSIGIFTTGIPTSGFATGNFVFFTRGRVFFGTIKGVADPKGASIKGILEATVAGSTTSSPAPGLVINPPSARGKMDARVTAPAGAAALSSVRIKGDATLFVSEGKTDPNSGQLIVSFVLAFAVDGFKQSNTPPSG